MNCQSYGRLGRRMRSDSAIVTIVIKRNYGSNSCPINVTLMMQFDVQKRRYLSQEQEQLLSIHQPNAFWKKMGSVGMSIKPSSMRSCPCRWFN